MPNTSRTSGVTLPPCKRWLSPSCFSPSRQSLPGRTPVPNDSTRITVPGCAKDRLFVVREEAEGREKTSKGVLPAAVPLSGLRAVLDDIRRREATMVEITFGK